MDQHTEGTMDTREIINGKLRLGQYCSSDDEEVIEKGVENVKRILADNFVRPRDL